MANHVLRDRLWHSDKLSKCSKAAALAWPWIMLVADDWGRFEYKPRRIWSLVFGAREDITAKDVTGWLSEYEAVGLLVRYHIEGDLAYWEGWEGRTETKRRKSLYPTPPDRTVSSPIPTTDSNEVKSSEQSGLFPVPDNDRTTTGQAPTQMVPISEENISDLSGIEPEPDSFPSNRVAAVFK